MTELAFEAKMKELKELKEKVKTLNGQLAQYQTKRDRLNTIKQMVAMAHDDISYVRIHFKSYPDDLHLQYPQLSDELQEVIIKTLNNLVEKTNDELKELENTLL